MAAKREKHGINRMIHPREPIALHLAWGLFPALGSCYPGSAQRFGWSIRQLEEIDLPELRRIGLRLQGVPRGAYLPYVTLGTTQKTES